MKEEPTTYDCPCGNSAWHSWWCHELTRLREAVEKVPRWSMREVDSEDDPLYDGMETNLEGDWVNYAELRRRAGKEDG